MLIFRNPGLIDLEAVRTLGVSVKLPGSFGRFGTGLKFAIARILRDGGAITIYRGLEAHTLGTVDREVRGETFQIVTLDGEPMGITTQLGKDWEPWMVLRELGCNALDEGGEFLQSGEIDEMILRDHEETTIIVNWPDLDLAYSKRDDLFLPAPTEDRPLLFANAHLRILDGWSSHIFYRGVRVGKLEKPSRVTYDILDEQKLTEDRTLAYMFYAERLMVNAYLQSDDRALLDKVLLAESYFEHSLDFIERKGWSVNPSKAFLDRCIEAREGGIEKSEALNPSAKKLLLASMRETAGEDDREHAYQRVVNDAFEYAKDQLSAIGIDFADEQVFITVDELPGEALSMVENGRVYLLAALFEKPARDIATELLTRYVDLKVSTYDLEGAVRLLAPFVLKALPRLAEDEALVAEDTMAGMGDVEVEPESPAPVAPSCIAPDGQSLDEDYPF